MQMDEYLTALTEQIRSKKARIMVEKEIKSHIEDQILAYQEEGMDTEAAKEKAIQQMGDPVAVGIDMDRIHRPRSGWNMIFLIMFISAVGLFAQYFFYYRFSDALLEAKNFSGSPLDVFFTQALFTGLGILVMTGIYRIDYSMLKDYSQLLGFCFLGGLILLCKSNILPTRNGCYSYLKCVLYLFVPIYGAILYQYRNHGFLGAGKSLVWIGAAYLTGIVYIGGGYGVTLDMIIICYLLFLTAVLKGWFSPSAKWPIFFAALAFPVIGAVFQFRHLAGYQLARIQALLHPELHDNESNYVLSVIKTILSSLRFYGTDTKTLIEESRLPMQILPDVRYDFILLQIASAGGILIAGLLIFLLTGFYLYLSKMVFRQKNQAGQIIGMGCVLVFVLETIRNIGNNFGFYVLSSGGLPFLSYGKTHTITIYALLGVLLSIYRYQDLVWENEGKKKEKYLIFLSER